MKRLLILASLSAALMTSGCITVIDADSDDMDNLLVLLATAGLNFMMGVPGADDVMLNYQSTSFHDALFVRQLLGLQRAPEFEAWLQRQGLTDGKGRLRPVSARPALSQSFSLWLEGPAA